MNDFYVNKIKDIRSAFSKPLIDPIEILENVSPPSDKIFKMPLITPDQTKKLILGQKNSSSTGYDAISNKIIRKIAP